MLSTDYFFAWYTFVITTILFVAIISTLLVYLLGILTRWAARRAMPVVVEDDGTEEASSSTSGFAHSRHMQMPVRALHMTPHRDASTQVDDWQKSPRFEIEWEIARRLAVDDFPLIVLEPILLQRDYHMREMYKRAGATYNCGTQQW